MSNNITELKAEEVSQEELDALEKLVEEDLPDGELRDFLKFKLEKIKENKNLYIISTY